MGIVPGDQRHFLVALESGKGPHRFGGAIDVIGLRGNAGKCANGLGANFSWSSTRSYSRARQLEGCIELCVGRSCDAADATNCSWSVGVGEGVFGGRSNTRELP